MQKRDWIILLSILLVGAALRFGGLAAPSLWDDEIHTVEFSQRPLGEMYRQSAHKDSNPLGFYLLLHAWLPHGDGEAFFRALPALFGSLTVLAMFWLGATLYDRSTGYLAALIAALHPLMIYSSQEVRAHTAALLALTLATTFLVRLLAQGRKRDAIGYGLCLGTALHLHYYAFFVLGGHALVLLVLLARDSRRARDDLEPFTCLSFMAAEQQNAQTAFYGGVLASGVFTAHRERLRGIALALAGIGGAAILFLPFFKVFAFQLLRGQAWRAPASLFDIAAKSMIYFAYGATPDHLPTFGLTFAPDKHMALLIVALTLAALPTVLLFIAGLRETDECEARTLTLALFATPLALAAFSLMLQPLFDVRHMLLLMPLGWLLIGRGLSRFAVKPRMLAIVLVLVCGPMVAALGQSRNDPAYARQDWRSAGAAVCEQALAGDLALAYHEEKSYAFRYYTRTCGLPVENIFDDRVHAMALMQRREAIGARLNELEIGVGRVWLVDYHGAVFDPADEIRAKLKNDGYFQIQRQSYDRGVKRFAIDLFTHNEAEAEKAFSPTLDLNGAYNPGQLLSGWYPPGEQGAWTGMIAEALLARRGEETLAVNVYVHRPFYDGPVPIRLYANDKPLAEQTVDQTAQVKISAKLPADLPDDCLLTIRLVVGRTFIPADVLNTADHTVKGVLVQKLALQ